MNVLRTVAAARSRSFVGALLVTTAFAFPAFAQVETVTVTAERKSENLQTAPVAVTALTSQDLKAKQVTNFRDLQFHVPSVTYTKSNFGGAQFQIRGITTQFGLGAAVAQNFDDVYLEAPALVTGEYYDVDRVEVARGPQSTSYGRAATGGAVNIISSKPDLDTFEAKGSVDYGTFATFKPDAMINIPIIDGELGVRLAVHGSFHGGYEKNDYTHADPGFGNLPQVFPGSPPDKSANSLGVMSGRASIRWQPDEDTTFDLVADVSFENDHRVRGDKMMCHFDPSGVAGCLPDKIDYEPFNTAATLGTTLGSAQGIAAALSGALSIGGALGPQIPSSAGSGSGVLQSIIPAPLDLAAAQLIGNTVGLCSIAGNGGPHDPNGPNSAAIQAAYLGQQMYQPAGPGTFAVRTQTPEVVNGPCSGATNLATGTGIVSKDVLTTNSAFNPMYKTYGGTYLLNWKEKLADWLNMDVDIGYADGTSRTQQGFTDATYENISPQILQAQQGFDIVFAGPGYTGLGGLGLSGLLSGLLPPTQITQLTNLIGGQPGAIATNAVQYDAAYYCNPGTHCGGVLPLSNVHYNGNRFDNYGGIIDNTRGGVLTWTPYNASYDQDWFQSREVTGEARFDTNFDFPVNFTSGLFYMTFNSENQYWVAADSLDWESAVLGAFLTPCNSTTHVCSTTPYMLAMPDFVAEYRRGFVQSRSAFLEATWTVFPDELKVIAGGRYNDDKELLLRTTKCTGGGLFLYSEPNPTDPKDPCVPGFGAPNATSPTGDLVPIGGQVHLPLDTRIPTFENGKKDVTTDLWTGRVSINWTPKLDFTQQTLVYFTASTGELAGGINVPNNGAQTIVPVVYKPATVNALELGTKNTLLDATLTANLTAWYYNYVNYQIVVIANRQALELNIPANLYGLEAEFVWQPTENLAFNMTTSLTHSAAGNVFVADERNITNNQPNSILVRDITNGSICVVVPHAFGSTPAAALGSTPGDSAINHVDNFYLPAGGDATQDASAGIPLVNYGICGGQGSAAQTQLRNKGYDYSTATSPTTGNPVQIPDASARAADIALGGDGLIHDGTGIARNLHGNRLPQVPFGQVGVGAQYTFKFGDWSIVPRLDYYWQSSMEARVWNDPVIDRINGWDIANGQIQLNAPDNRWYVQVFAKNIFDKHNPTGEYLQDPAAGLYTNVFSEDPRVVGFSVGAHW